MNRQQPAWFQHRREELIVKTTYMNFNRVLLLDNLTRDPEFDSPYQCGSIATFTTNRRVKKGDEKVEEATYHTIVVFGKQAESSAQYFKKASVAHRGAHLPRGRHQDDMRSSGNRQYL